MLPRITEVKHLRGYLLEVTFSDGVRAKLDFRRRVCDRGGVFQALEDIEFFGRVRVDPEIGTLVWPNDVDFCPDVLHAEAVGKLTSAFR